MNYDNYVDATFLQHVRAKGLSWIHEVEWVTDASLSDTPGDTLLRTHYFASSRDEGLAQLQNGLAHLTLSDRSFHAVIAAKSEVEGKKAEAELTAALPKYSHSDSEVPVRIWWWVGHGAQAANRVVAAPAWTDLQANYGPRTRGVLSEAMKQTHPTVGGRLLLFHGAPGTGKTTAIRSLAASWQNWADFQFVTDPEFFLSSPSYLMNVSAPQRGRDRSRWRVIVLEDAGEFLVPDAKHLQGQAMSRLLNVCDGVLGEAMRALIVVTTNEPLRDLHPALARPGRCSLEVEFGALTPQQAAAWWAANAEGPFDSHNREWSLAELFALAAGRGTDRSAARPFGFTFNGALA